VLGGVGGLPAPFAGRVEGGELVRWLEEEGGKGKGWWRCGGGGGGGDEDEQPGQDQKKKLPEAVPPYRIPSGKPYEGGCFLFCLNRMLLAHAAIGDTGAHHSCAKGEQEGDAPAPGEHVLCMVTEGQGGRVG